MWFKNVIKPKKTLIYMSTIHCLKQFGYQNGYYNEMSSLKYVQ